MFTGIVQARGAIVALDPVSGDGAARDEPPDLRISIETPVGYLDDCGEGDSISCSGICLTAVAYGPRRFHVDASRETLRCTTMGEWRVGDAVNLERALTPSTPLGGHLVSGHVDGIATVVGRQPEARSVRWTFAAPQALGRYIAPKGSICIDGVSLTVNGVEDARDEARFDVNIIPHTADVTGFSAYELGSHVNIEVDLVARYLARLVDTQRG